MVINKYSICMAVLVFCIILAKSGGAAQGSVARVVSLKSADGFILKGKYFSKGAIGPGILLLHQCDRKPGTNSGYDRLAGLLANQGFHVLTLDFRSYGESVSEEFPAGSWNKAHAHMREDVEAAYDFLASQSEVLKDTMGVAGASCGGREATLTAAAHPEVKTLVLISSVIGGPSLSAYAQLRHLPLLGITSLDDPYGGTAEAMKRVSADSRNKASKLLTYRGRYHGTPLFEQYEELEPKIVHWFKTHLLEESRRK